MNPYRGLPPRQFWRTAIAQPGLPAVDELWIPKFAISNVTRVATFGSCFAQHFGKSLRERGFSWFVTEPAPDVLSEASRKKFSYDLFSARTGNIYTASLLRQWVGWALGDAQPDEIWRTGDRFHDPFRPTVEPGGFASEQELVENRNVTIRSLRQALIRADVLVFTLGLTESWVNSSRGHEYPLCPGTAAGVFDAAQHEFVNQDYPYILDCMRETLLRIWDINPALRVLLTVSPVPLAATMSRGHVLVATTESKAKLRAVAGAIARDFAFVDYFPSYELISAAPYRGMFFDDDQRTVTAVGIEHVMNAFFQCQLARSSAHVPTDAPHILRIAEKQDPVSFGNDDDVVCEEALLDAFAPAKQSVPA